MKLWAISDLHVGIDLNRQIVSECASFPEDWLILAGDMGESTEHLDWTLATLKSRFAKLLWVPGNHDLWSGPEDPLRGVARYEALVEICRSHDVLTPEDPYAIWDGDGEGGPHTIALLHVLYDYTFGPDEITNEHATVADALAWAAESGIECADERYLDPTPFASRVEWCHERVRLTEARLNDVPYPTILVNHYPLRQQLAVLPAIPRFSIWCGTRKTEDWAQRYQASVAVSGHLHLRSTRTIDGTRFEEVSLGYPRQWNPSQDMASYLRLILPGRA